MKRKNVGNSARKSRLDLLTEEIENLKKRVGRLEAAAFDPSVPLGDGQEIPEAFRPIPPKRGRKPKWDIREAKVFRIELLNLLREFWPSLRPLFATRIPAAERRGKMEALLQREVLGDPLKLGHLVRAAHHLLTHNDELDYFLRSGRYRGTPGSVANAMAGVPNVSWKTSLKRLARKRASALRQNPR